MNDGSLDRELCETFEVISNYPANPKPGRGRSVRPGKNALRRMKVSHLVREYRTECVERERVGSEAKYWRELAEELERRELPKAAQQVRADSRPRGERALTTVMAASAIGILAAIQERNAGEDEELAGLESLVEARAEELRVDELPAETERETDALSEAEYLADLQEIGASSETVDAEAFTAEIAGDQPAKGMDPNENVPFTPMESLGSVTEVESTNVGLDLS